MADPISPESNDPAQSLIFAYAAPVTVRSGGSGSDDLLAIAKQRAPDPEALDEFPPFFFSVIPSTNSLDSYFTAMSASSLKNYAADFAEGRAFQDSHRHDEMPLGYSLTGKYVGSNGNGIARVESDFFIPRGVSSNGDAAIARIRTGAVKDTSIGFHGGQWTCSICGRDMLTDWDCWHIPGMSYSADEKDMEFFFAQQTARAPKKKADAPPERLLCTASIENARAAECSGVFDGATPGAVIKAQRMADAGRLAPAAARLVESQFHVRIHGADQTWRGFSPPKPERSLKEGRMTIEEQIRELLGLTADAEPLDAVRSLKAEAGRTADLSRRLITAESFKKGTEEFTEKARSLGWSETSTYANGMPMHPFGWVEVEIERLRPLADDGKRYRDDLIEDAIKEGIRADEAFPVETFKGILARSTIDEIKVMRANWATKGAQNHQGGRQTGDDESGGAPVDLDARRKPSKRAVARV